LRFLQLLRSPGEVAEIRILKHNIYGHSASGYFDSMELAAHAAMAWDGRANVYVTLNPVMPDLLARAVNRILPKAEATTADEQIVSRRWLFLDVDAKRPSGISSTKEELEAARQVLEKVVLFLSAQDWPLPIEAMSGNGYRVLYRIDLPNDKEAAQLVKDVLDSLAGRFDTPEAHIDTSVSNAARLVGLVGTLKVKGDHTDERPHRRSFLELVPDSAGLVSVDQLRALASESVSKNKASAEQRQTGRSRGLSLREVLEQNGIEFREQPPDARGIVWYHVAQCPFHDDGQLFECGVGQKLPDGAFAGHCFHPEGTGNGWREWKAALGLGPDSESSLSSMH
jgi:hypothetical protein